MKKIILVIITIILMTLLVGCTHFNVSSTAEVYKNVEVELIDDWNVNIENNDIKLVLHTNFGRDTEGLKDGYLYNVYKFGERYIFICLDEIK